MDRGLATAISDMSMFLPSAANHLEMMQHTHVFIS